ncbi:hypothetical protein BDZ45DRAFT_147087 [Acephala macrosclerotiorum]|nr:hypothetical protein BDZ45DRAFT_147087 [Acephala macrosclerotiorum]
MFHNWRTCHILQRAVCSFHNLNLSVSLSSRIQNSLFLTAISAISGSIALLITLLFVGAIARILSIGRILSVPSSWRWVATIRGVTRGSLAVFEREGGSKCCSREENQREDICELHFA